MWATFYSSELGMTRVMKAYIDEINHNQDL